jgi:pimeloyl-ACP methyl ester carboxylesterase
MNHSGWLERLDCRIYYEIAGSGPALVFAHGLGGNHLSWWQQLAHFSPRYTCVAFAHRGFTPSSAVPGTAAPDAYAEDLTALIDALGLKDVRLVAQSMGGWTCLDYALKFPARVRALVMACTSGAVDPGSVAGFDKAAFDDWLRRAGETAAGLESRGILAASGERMAKEQPALATLYRQIYQQTPADFRTAVRLRIRELRVQPATLLAKLAMPVLFLNGEEDCVFPAPAGPGLAQAAAQGRHVSVPRAGHSVYFERAAEFNRIVEDFLQ